ncbi:MAG: hypothetical protein J7J20_00240 [Desulfurococcales archaeon]|nr:hypothetical protein [Desulfurococcales archaeon]
MNRMKYYESKIRAGCPISLINAVTTHHFQSNYSIVYLKAITTKYVLAKVMEVNVGDSAW